MDITRAYKFCPLCASVVERVSAFHLLCTICQFDFFIDPAVAGEALILNEMNEILLIKRKVNPHKDMWDVPGGFVEPGEDLSDAIIREIKEELGIQLLLTGFVGAFADSYEFRGIIKPVLRAFYIAKELGGKMIAQDDVSAFSYFPLQEIANTPLAFTSTRLAIAKIA